VGRWMELSRLDLAYQSARIGRTEVVLIAGEPGIGKSRLVSEFIGLVTADDGAAGNDAPRVLRWTFSRVNQRSYAGFIEPLLVELRIDPNDPEASAKLPEKLRELNFANPELVAPTLAQFFHFAGATEPPSDSEEWKRATFNWIPDELRNKIVARAGGNPFFVEESIRSLVESGAVAKDEKGEWQLRERPAALEVPATLHGVVAARIDRLPPSAKETIQLA